MEKSNKKRKPRKELSIAVKLIIILVFSGAFVFFGICIGFLINSFLNFSTYDIITNTFLSTLVGIVYMALLLILIRDSDTKNVRPVKWYFNCVLISFIITLVITALTVFTLGVEEGNDINYFVGFGMFPLIGIVSTPNVIKHVKKDTNKWKSIFYDKGNLHTMEDSVDYYKVNTPVPFEKELLSTLYKEQLKNILVVIGIIALVITFCIYHLMKCHSYSGRIISDLIELRIERKFGFIFFWMIFFIVFGIPIICYYVYNAIKKIRVLKNHEYIAYHAIIPGVHNGKVGFYHAKRHYEYKYCTCVGIKEKDVHNTPATLIFLPDDVLLFPDSEVF